MDIRLTGALPTELKSLGLKSGMKFQDVQPAPGFPKGTVEIRWIDDGEEMRAIVRTYYYDEISKWPRISFNRNIMKFRKLQRQA